MLNIKKLLMLILSSAILFSMSACGNNGGTASNDLSALPQSDLSSEDGADTSTQSNEPEMAGSRSLVAYFSWSGNTESVAREIQNQTGADIFEIAPATPYTSDYNELLDIAREEQNSDARPTIQGEIGNFANYDVIYVGYPNWWGDMPMILYSLFDTYDFSGKIIAPFCTSGGSGLSGTVATIEGLEPDATVTEGLHIGSGNASNPAADVTEWLNSIGQGH